MCLRAQGVREAVHAEAGGKSRELGRIADRGDMADLATANANRAAACQEHAAAGEQDLVLVVQPAREEFQQATLRGDLQALLAYASRGQHAQRARLALRQTPGTIPTARPRTA